MRAVTLRDRAGRHVKATTRDDGAPVIQGQVLRESPWGSEADEYALIVADADLPAVVAALGAAAGADALDVLEAHGEGVVIGGERAWFRSVGIELEFASTEG